MMAQTPPSPPQMALIFRKKQSTCTYIRTHILLKDTKVNHLCRKKNNCQTLTFGPKWSIKSSLYSSNLIPGISVFTANKHSHCLFFYIFPKVSRHGNISLKVNKKFKNTASSSDVLQIFWFLNGISALFTKTTSKDSHEQNSVNIARQHSMDRWCFNWQMKSCKFLLY